MNLRTTVLIKIEADDNLSKLFNMYMSKLFTIDIMSFPMDNMRDTMLNKNGDKIYNALSYYELTTLRNSLHSIHNCIIKSIELINNYEKEFKFNWKDYATTTRFNFLNENGSEDDNDYNSDGSLKYLEDSKSLKYFTFKNELGFNFENNDLRGEFIGSSSVTDYRMYSKMITNLTDFSIFKFLSDTTGKELPIYKQNKDGEMCVVGTADRIESEINEDINNSNVVSVFEKIINECSNLFILFNNINEYKNEKEKYIKLRNYLIKILNVDL